MRHTKIIQVRQMLVVRYSKSGGAEFISHLDTLRHLQKIITRAKIPVEYSKGFNPHMLIFMSSPIAAGLISFAEYFFVQTDIGADEFKEKFNANCPRGFSSICAKEVDKNPNLAAMIDGASYTVENVPEIDVEKILSSSEFYITDKRGERKNVRDKIKKLRYENGNLFCELDAGNSPLRVDLFVKELESAYGFFAGDIVKTEAYIKGQLVENAV